MYNRMIYNLKTRIGIAVVILGAIASAITLYGYTGSVTLGIIVTNAFLFIFFILFLIDNIKKKSSIFNIRKINLVNGIYDVFKYFKNTKDIVKTIFVLGSGTETYYGIIENLLKQGQISKGIEINIGYRIGKSEIRIKKLNDYNIKWRDLSELYQLTIKYYPMKDFQFNFRGLVINKSVGFIGFYHRINKKTYGSSEKCMVLFKDGAIGTYIIDNFIKTFKTIDECSEMIYENVH